MDEVSIVRPEQLVALKVRAWLDLTARKASGGPADEKDITKHERGILQMYRVMDPTVALDVPEPVRADMEAILEAMTTEDVDVKGLEIFRQTKAEVLEELRRVFVHR